MLTNKAVFLIQKKFNFYYFIQYKFLHYLDLLIGSYLIQIYQFLHVVSMMKGQLMAALILVVGQCQMLDKDIEGGFNTISRIFSCI